MILRFLLPLAALSSSLSASTLFWQSFSLLTPIPDNSTVGLSDTRTLNVPEITEITEIEIGLTLSGGWLGDLYGFVQHDSGFAVLLNRVGRTAGDPLGSPASSLDVTFSLSGPDIHLATAPFIGTFGPDARETHPATVLDSDPRTASLDSFLGLPASGDWTLFLADLSPGDIMTVDSWSLSITGIPEPASAATFFGTAACLVLAASRRRVARL
jgi:hypothetical protein